MVKALGCSPVPASWLIYSTKHRRIALEQPLPAIRIVNPGFVILRAAFPHGISIEVAQEHLAFNLVAVVTSL